MLNFEQPKPYSEEEQKEIKEELERQADEKREEPKEKESEEEPRRPYSKEEWEKIVKARSEQELEKPEEIEKIEQAPEKTKEQVLTEARENFARTQLDKAETLKKIEKIKGEVSLNDLKPDDLEKLTKADPALLNKLSEMEDAKGLPPEEQELWKVLWRKETLVSDLKIKGSLDKDQAEKAYQEAIDYLKTKEQYQEASKGVRAGMYEKALAEIEKLGLPEEKANELMRQKMEEIVKTTVVAEANNLYNTKTRISLETKGDASFFEKSWKTAGKAVEWYRKLPLKYKLMVSAGLLAGGVAAGAAGGATGAALAAGVVTGRWFQRAFGGAATAVGLEGLIKRSQEKRAEKKTFKEFGDKLSELIKTNDKGLDERLLELEGKKKSEKTRRYILAGAAGAVVASGLLGRAIRWGMEETGLGKSIKGAVSSWFEHKPATPEMAVSRGPGYVGAGEYPPYEAPPGEEVSAYEALHGGPQIAGKGDSVWKIIGRQMSDRYGEKFNNLDEARKTYVIDAIKDKVAVDPEKYGLTNVDQIQAGKTYDFLPGNKMEVEKIIGEATDLKQAQTENILKTNRLIEEWFKTHSGEKPTGQMYEILYGKKADTILEALSEKTPPEELPGEYVPEKIPPEELPGEYVSEKPKAGIAEAAAEVEKPKGEVILTDYESPEQIAAEMAKNEIANVRGIGFTEGEYKAIQNFKIGRLFELISSKSEAWELWRGEESLKLMEIPHDGFYGASEFKRHIQLVEFIRSFSPGDGIKEMTIQQFLRMVGPK